MDFFNYFLKVYQAIIRHQVKFPMFSDPNLRPDLRSPLKRLQPCIKKVVHKLFRGCFFSILDFQNKFNIVLSTFNIVLPFYQPNLHKGIHCNTIQQASMVFLVLYPIQNKGQRCPLFCLIMSTFTLTYRSMPHIRDEQLIIIQIFGVFTQV